ncbi:hypothetical protein, partial [Bifidobacterium breve]
PTRGLNVVGGLSGGGREEEVLENNLKVAVVVPEVDKKQVRTSPRLQQSKDEHVLAKAQERAARKNLEFHGGNPHPISLFSFNKDKALEYLQQIGFNLGTTSVNKEDNLQTLLNLELERDEVENGGLEDAWLDSISDSDEENIDTLRKKRL